MWRGATSLSPGLTVILGILTKEPHLCLPEITQMYGEKSLDSNRRLQGHCNDGAQATCLHAWVKSKTPQSVIPGTHPIKSLLIWYTLENFNHSWILEGSERGTDLYLNVFYMVWSFYNMIRWSEGIMNSSGQWVDLASRDHLEHLFTENIVVLLYES